MADEVLGAVDDVVVPVAHRPRRHRPDVGPRAGLAHRETVVALTLDGRHQIAIALVALARLEDVAGSGHEPLERIAGLAELALRQGHAHGVQTAPAELGGHVRGMESGLDRALPDLGRQLLGDLVGPLHLLLMGIQLPGDERAHRVDDRPLLVVETEVHDHSYPSCPSCSVLASDAHRPADHVRAGQCGMGRGDRVEPRPQQLRQVGRPAGLGVDVNEQLLGGGDEYVGLAVAHLVEEVQPTIVVVEDLQGHHEGLAERDLVSVVEMRLGGVQRVPGRPVGLVDAEKPEEGVGVVPEREQEAGLAHVVVVVHPLRRRGGAVQAQRRVDDCVVVPDRRSALVRRGDPVVHGRDPTPRPRCGGRGCSAWASRIASTRVRRSSGRTALRPTVVSTWT